MVNEQELLAFIERILSNSSPDIAGDRCAELLRALKDQNLLTPELQQAVTPLTGCIPEMYQVFPNGKKVTMAGLREADRRAAERRRREEEARDYGRC